MRRYKILTTILALTLLLCLGCGNPLRRPPNNVFPGSDEYIKRVDSFKITPPQAYERALAMARRDNKLQFLSRRPTVVVKRWYVFSMPQPSGASLQGYHVNGDTGKVRFVAENQTIRHAGR